VDQRRIANLLQLIVLASLGYAIYNAWSIYNGFEAQLARSAVSAFQGLGGSSGLSGITDQLNNQYGWAHLLINQPWMWLGVVLIFAPAVLGMSRKLNTASASAGSVSPEPSFEYLVECPLCKKPISSSAAACPHCGHSMP
jgi:hypothetical protein